MVEILAEQNFEGVRRPIAFASRYLGESGAEYAPNELDLLGVVWGVEHFKHYLLGKKFPLETDHKALIPVTNRQNVNNDYSPRLIRLRHRSLLHEIDVDNVPGEHIGREEAPISFNEEAPMMPKRRQTQKITRY